MNKYILFLFVFKINIAYNQNFAKSKSFNFGIGNFGYDTELEKVSGSLSFQYGYYLTNVFSIGGIAKIKPQIDHNGGKTISFGLGTYTEQVFETRNKNRPYINEYIMLAYQKNKSSFSYGFNLALGMSTGIMINLHDLSYFKLGISWMTVFDMSRGMNVSNNILGIDFGLNFIINKNIKKINQSKTNLEKKNEVIF